MEGKNSPIIRLYLWYGAICSISKKVPSPGLRSRGGSVTHYRYAAQKRGERSPSPGTAFSVDRAGRKTTCARILAKVINAGADLSEDELALNIFELDAASNNSVDDIRRLIGQVRFAPQTGKFKVYIIDEVHMLSQQAFNAFLKTLEEPPTHAIFILATTEKHKIIPTILSRCQIFDFKRITVEDIANHLAYVADQEGINAEPEALHMIAEKADGALRDALSLFDRMISFSGNTLTYTQVVEVLDILDYNYYFKGVGARTKRELPRSTAFI